MQKQQKSTIHYEPTWESLAQYAVPQWFKDAKLGIFIHWGILQRTGFRQRVVCPQYVSAGQP